MPLVNRRVNSTTPRRARLWYLLAPTTAVLLVTSALSSVLLATGPWSLIILPAIAACGYFAADLFRATLLTFALLAPLSERPAFLGTLWYIVLATLGIAWLKQMAFGPKRIPIHYCLLYGGFLAAIGLSILFEVSIPQGAEVIGFRVAPLAASLLSLFLAPAVSDRRQLRALLWGIVLTGVVYAFSIFFMPDLGSQRRLSGQQDYLRSRGFYSIVHVAGLHQVFSLTAAAILFVTEDSRRKRLFSAACVILLLAATAITGSRTAFVAIAMIGAVWLFMDISFILPRLKIAHLYVATLFLLVAVPYTIRKIAEGGYYAVGLTAGQVGGGLAGRLFFIDQALDLFARNPLTGVGWGNSFFLIPPALVPIFFEGIPWITTYYFTILAETGLIGFALYLSIIGMTIYHLLISLRAFRRQGDWQMYQMSRLFLFSFLSALLMMILQGNLSERLFWACVGMALAVRRIAGHDEAREAPG